MAAVVLDELVDAVLPYVGQLVFCFLPGQGSSDREDGAAFAHVLLVLVARARRADGGFTSLLCGFYVMRGRVRHVTRAAARMQHKMSAANRCSAGGRQRARMRVRGRAREHC